MERRAGGKLKSSRSILAETVKEQELRLSALRHLQAIRAQEIAELKVWITALKRHPALRNRKY